MQHEFWKQRWEQGQIGFHMPVHNPRLERWWPELGVDPDVAVLVPLCGKSLDLSWLAQRGHPVVGVELSELACVAFFKEQGLVPAVDQEGLFRRYRSGDITVLEGDFFLLPPEPTYGAVYERASLIALPPSMREGYANKLIAVTAPGAKVLLVTLDYPEGEKQGPPFNVSGDEVRALYGADFSVRHLETTDILAQDPARYPGMTRVVEEVWLLERRG